MYKQVNKEESSVISPISPISKAAVCTARASGPLCREMIRKMIPAEQKKILAQPGKMIYSKILDLEEKTDLDFGLVVFFSAPASFTGEDVVEFHLHGSSYLMQRLLENALSIGFSLARAGEFTERAFLNGKIDLTQAEAICDLVSCQTRAQAEVARGQLKKHLSDRISQLGEPLRNILAHVEAYIDFPDEGIELEALGNWKEEILQVKGQLQQYIDSYSSGRILRDGAKVVLSGLPNAGKSSLLNALLREKRVIVSDIEGTTRDSIEETLSLNGVKIHFWDTAGLVEESEEKREIGEIEKEGIERSWSLIEEADLVLYVFDVNKSFSRNKKIIDKLQTHAKKILLLKNKIDLRNDSDTPVSYHSLKILDISAKENIGLDKLEKKISELLIGQKTNSDLALICNKRHKEALEKSYEYLSNAYKLLEANKAVELLAFELRASLSALEEIIGSTPTEDILGKIFSEFCVGK